MIYIVRINDKEYEVEVEKGRATIQNVAVVEAAPAPVPHPVPQAVPSVPVPAHAAQGAPVKAPMPGTVLDVKATPGVRVQKGDVLLILEAMKMENEIAAPEDGVVAQVLVGKGASVSTGDVLITLQ